MAKKHSRQKAYFGFGRILSIIFAIIPLTNIIFGWIIRAQRKNWLGLVLNIIPIFWPIFWIMDIITVCAQKDLTILA